MKNEENKIQTDRNEILKICTRFYTELYSSTPQRPTPPAKNYQPRLIRSHTNDIRSQENPETVKVMKKNKAPGRENLTSDIMIFGEEESVKQQHFLIKS